MENYIQHHGVKGQKWGVRRYQNPDGSLTAAGQRRQAKIEKKQAVKQKRSDVKNRRILTDEELRAKVNRLQMEKQLRQLTDEDVNRGRVAVKNFMGRVGNKVFDTAASVAGKAAVGLGGAAISAFAKGNFTTSGFKESWSFGDAAKMVADQFKKK